MPVTEWLLTLHLMMHSVSITCITTLQIVSLMLVVQSTVDSSMSLCSGTCTALSSTNAIII